MAPAEPGPTAFRSAPSRARFENDEGAAGIGYFADRFVSRPNPVVDAAADGFQVFARHETRHDRHLRFACRIFQDDIIPLPKTNGCMVDQLNSRSISAGIAQSDADTVAPGGISAATRWKKSCRAFAIWISGQLSSGASAANWLLPGVAVNETGRARSVRSK